MKTRRIRWTIVITLIAACPWLTTGCMGDTLRQNQKQLEMQQAELMKIEREIETLKLQQSQTYASAPKPPGSCEKEVERRAAAVGTERMAAGRYDSALGYFQDALTACPRSAEAELNLAKTYEAMGNRGKAREYYEMASQSAESGQKNAVKQANAALLRLKTGR